MTATPLLEVDEVPAPEPATASATTRALVERLGLHYAGGRRRVGEAHGGVLITEAGLNTGGAQRRVDVVHVGFTASSGQLLRGHEVKVSRADWLHELGQPVKADVWAAQCHEWWLVTPHATIVKEGELPAGWGHMVPDPRSKFRFKIVVPAERKPAEFAPSWLIVRSLFARLDTVQRATQIATVQEAKAAARAAVEDELRQLREQVSDHWADQADGRLWRDLITGLGSEDQTETITRAEIRNALLAVPGLRALDPERFGLVPTLVNQLRSLAEGLLALQQAVHEQKEARR